MKHLGHGRIRRHQQCGEGFCVEGIETFFLSFGKCPHEADLIIELTRGLGAFFCMAKDNRDEVHIDDNVYMVDVGMATRRKDHHSMHARVASL